MAKDGHSQRAETLLTCFCVACRLHTAEGMRRSSSLESSQNSFCYHVKIYLPEHLNYSNINTIEIKINKEPDEKG